MNKFVFIAVNYNSFNFTKEYIHSINKITIDKNDKVEIIIVDNQSELDDFESLKAYCKTIDNVRIVRSNRNLGYFKGLNQGIIDVNKDNHTMLIIGNNDLTFDKEFIQNLKKIDYGNDVLVIAPNIITKEGRQQNPHVIDRVPTIEKIKARVYFTNYYVGQAFRFINQSLRRLINKPVVLKNTYGQMKIKRGIGACYVLTPNFFNHFDKLDDRVFMWGEEALLSNQVESVNGYTLYDPTIKITHHESASVSSIQSKQKYYMVKESYKIYRKYL
ncbi:MAG: glycosyltransferase [Tepidibacillus sp.]